jgi:hypothetical protein
MIGRRRKKRRQEAGTRPRGKEAFNFLPETEDSLLE